MYHTLATKSQTQFLGIEHSDQIFCRFFPLLMLFQQPKEFLTAIGRAISGFEQHLRRLFSKQGLDFVEA